MELTRTNGPFGIMAEGVDLSGDFSDDLIAELRSAWVQNKVLVIPDQHLTEQALEKVSAAFGPFGEDPFFGYIDGSEHIAEIRREADETSPLFADVWHSDWSFLPEPPTGTLLYAKVIPPHGGDTLYMDNNAAYEALPEDIKNKIENLNGIHSPIMGYSKEGLYGDIDEGRSMDIRPSDDAKVFHPHPLVITHGETGKKSLFINPGYTLEIEGLDKDEGRELLLFLFKHQAQEQFIYQHHWEKDMLVIWDNRSVNHKATGGYEGYQHVLQRTTVKALPGLY